MVFTTNRQVSFDADPKKKSEAAEVERKSTSQTQEGGPAVYTVFNSDCDLSRNTSVMSWLKYTQL